MDGEEKGLQKSAIKKSCVKSTLGLTIENWLMYLDSPLRHFTNWVTGKGSGKGRWKESNLFRVSEVALNEVKRMVEDPSKKQELAIEALKLLNQDQNKSILKNYETFWESTVWKGSPEIVVKSWFSCVGLLMWTMTDSKITSHEGCRNSRRVRREGSGPVFWSFDQGGAVKWEASRLCFDSSVLSRACIMSAFQKCRRQN